NLVTSGKVKRISGKILVHRRTNFMSIERRAGKGVFRCRDTETLLFPGHHELRCPQQGPLDLRIGEAADGFAGGFRILSSTRMRSLQRTVAAQDVENL